MKNLLFFINHIDNSITKTLIYYFVVLSFTVSAFMIGMTANIIGNKGTIKIETKKDKTDTAEYFNTSINSKTFDENGNKIVDKNEDKSTFNKSVIFGSSKGKYFYYKGCGGDSIAAKNLRYYKSEAEAIKLGKKLYNKCQ